MKAVLWISQFGPKDSESASNRLRKLSKGLLYHGIQVEWCFPGEKQSADGAFAVSPPIGRRRGAAKALILIILIVKMTLFASRWLRSRPDGVIVFTLPPAWILLVAWLLSRIYPDRFILDYRDPVINPTVNPRPRAVDACLRWIEQGTVRRSWRVIVSAPRIRNYLPKGTQVTEIYSGIDPDEASASPAQAQVNEPRPIQIVYGGTFYGTRSPIPLLSALGTILPKDLVKKFEIVFYASFSSDQERSLCESLISRYDLTRICRLETLIDRERFLKEIASSDLLLVITHNEGTDYAIPGKIFDYLSFQKPMLILSEDEGIKELLEEFQIPAWVSPNTSIEIGTLLERLVREFHGSSKSYAHISEELSCLTQAKKLINLTLTQGD